MNALDSLMLMVIARAQAFAYDLTHDEEGAVDLITIVVLIGIAVVLALVFREALEDLLKTLLETIKGKAKTAVQ